jgi:uncharacterized membrane protein YgcG
VALLGATPRMTPGVSSPNNFLSTSEQTSLRKKIAVIESRFPQIVLQVVIRQLPQIHPFALYAFWLFNAGAFAGEGRRGKHNRVVLLLIDPSRQESALMPGYGLENVLNPEALNHLLDLAGPVWAAGLWAEGIERVLSGLDHLLQRAGTPELATADEGEF